MNGMQQEIDQLRINIRDMENNELEDREILKEISEFNRKVSKIQGHVTHKVNEKKFFFGNKFSFSCVDDRGKIQVRERVKKKLIFIYMKCAFQQYIALTLSTISFSDIIYIFFLLHADDAARSIASQAIC